MTHGFRYFLAGLFLLTMAVDILQIAFYGDGDYPRRATGHAVKRALGALVACLLGLSLLLWGAP